ncbi:MAG TPA: STAS domain-containing protein [Acidimicrobiales bacterium]|nr:STAS domain-containing protein [Acidimicrobiales bacterium]
MPDARLARADSYSASRVTSSSFSDAAVFHLQGDLDRGTAAGLRVELRAAVGEAMVLLDLTGVVFIDSIGVGVLLGAIRSIHERGGVVAIGGADSRRGIAGALRSAGVERLVFLSESPAGAMEWLRQDRR